MKKQGARYMNSVKKHSLVDLSVSLHIHRSLQPMMQKNGLKGMTAEEAVSQMDQLCQEALDGILDSLVGCLEMGLAEEVLKGINETMLIKRGFKKKTRADNEK